MIKTDIPKLDELLQGGIKEGSAVCLWATPGTTVEPFINQIIPALTKEEMLIYVLSTKNMEAAKTEMQQAGVTPEKLEFVDAYSSLVKQKSNAKFIVEDSKNSADIIAEVGKALTAAKGRKVLFFDSISTLLDLVTDKEAFIKALKQVFEKEKEVTKIVSFTEWEPNASFSEKFRSLFDAIIELKMLEKKLFIKHFFSVTKLSWAKEKLSAQIIPYRAKEKEGIKIYIPKVLVTGPFNSGKTSFIHSASTKAVSVDRLGTTIALDHGHCDYKGFDVDLFGTPGQERFDPILKLLGGEAFGVVIVVSTTDPAGFDRAREMIEKTGTIGLPYVVMANKSDLRGAVPDTAIRSAMGLPNEVPIIRSTATDLAKVQPGLPCQLKNEDIEKVLDAIFTKLLEPHK